MASWPKPLVKNSEFLKSLILKFELFWTSLQKLWFFKKFFKGLHANHILFCENILEDLLTIKTLYHIFICLKIMNFYCNVFKDSLSWIKNLHFWASRLHKIRFFRFLYCDFFKNIFTKSSRIKTLYFLKKTTSMKIMGEFENWKKLSKKIFFRHIFEKMDDFKWLYLLFFFDFLEGFIAKKRTKNLFLRNSYWPSC